MDLSWLSWLAALFYAAWLVFQALRRKQGAPGGEEQPPGGRVVAVHDAAEWTSALDGAAAAGELLVVDFTASWCPPCRRVAPICAQSPAHECTRRSRAPPDAELSERFPGVRFLKVDVDKARAVASAQGVSASAFLVPWPP